MIVRRGFHTPNRVTPPYRVLFHYFDRFLAEYETVLLDVPHRQVVFTIPKMLRIFFKYNRRLLGELCGSALRSLTRYFEVVTGSELMPGVLAAIQTFGNRINAHPHLPFLVTEGGVDKAGLFHKIPRLDDSRLAELFAREVPGFLVHKELLSPEWADRLLSWRYTGFNVHSRVRAKTKREAERVGKYMIQPLLSLERLSLDVREGQVTVRYYGLYANAHGFPHRLCRGGQDHQPPPAELCRGEAPFASYRLPGTLDGPRGPGCAFFV